MNPKFETKRLILREFIPADADALYYLNLDPQVLKYTGDVAFDGIESAKAFLENYDQYQKYGYGRWAVLKKETGEFIGWCGLKNHDGKFIDIGFRFFRKEWNNGYASEAAAATLAYGFNVLKLDEIIGRASQANKASIRILEKLGMKFIRIDSCHGIDNAAIYSAKNLMKANET